MLDWLVVGGGVHGTHLAIVLLARARVPRARLRILDPHEVPLARWHARTAAVGMRFLRSTGVHHVDIDPLSLLRFARRMDGGGRRHLAYPYDRPSLPLFAAHAGHTEDTWDLGPLRERGAVVALHDGGDHVRVETDRGELRTRRVLLAVGRDACRAPAWAESLEDGSAGLRLEHVFHAGFRLDPGSPQTPRMTVVVGEGMSAAQAATHLARRARAAGSGTVALLVRRDPPVHPFDTDPGWIGPRRLTGFSREHCPARRRRTIDAARHAGSVTPEVRRELRMLTANGSLRMIVSADVRVGRGDGGEIVLGTAAGEIRPDRMLCATGFSRSRPGGAWLDRAIETFGLPVAPCGYPLADEALRWHPRIHVAGPLAELTLGPAAQNIVGARHAGEILAAV